MRCLGLMLALALFAPSLFVQSASADALDLGALAATLRHESPELRSRAAEQLSTLPRDELAAIDARLIALKRRVIDPEEGYQALRAFAHAAGSRRADETFDIEPGVHKRLLEVRPSAVEAAIAEELLLLRSLEKMRSARAYRRSVQLFALHFDVFRWEARHSMARMGYLAMPAILDGISLGDAGLAAVARAAHAALNQPAPAEALRELEGEDRAELLLAYASRRVMDAMEPAAVFLNDPDPIVRRAAITAVKRYGRNAIWQIREAALLFLGEELDRSMGHEASLEYLLQRLDVQRAKPQLLLLQRSRMLFEGGELEEARGAIDRLWAERPELDEDGLGSSIYEALGERAYERGDLDEAGRAFTHAALLARDEERKRELEARTKELQREQLKAAGYFYLDEGEQEPSEAETGEQERAAEASMLPPLLFLSGLALLVGWGRTLRVAGSLLNQIKKAGRLVKGSREPMLARLREAGRFTTAALGAALDRRKAARLVIRERLDRSRQKPSNHQNLIHQAAGGMAESQSGRRPQHKAESPQAFSHKIRPQETSAEETLHHGTRAQTPSRHLREQLPINLLKTQTRSHDARHSLSERASADAEPVKSPPALPPKLVFRAPKERELDVHDNSAPGAPRETPQTPRTPPGRRAI